MANGEPPISFRQLQTEKLRQQFRSDVDQLLNSFVETRKKFRGDVPPLLLLSLPEDEQHQAWQKEEKSHRERINKIIRTWIVSGEWPEIAARDEFWLATRFEHGHWLAICLLTPDEDGVSRYVPRYADSV
ncbi:MAG TPA: hypothetical protein VGM58_10695 [Verrucomicrobiae bacterium]|jgi:hypothetical protein